jgi:hypothetical protein
MIGDPTVLVTCNGCGCEEEYGLTPTARGYDERNLHREIVARGWYTDGADGQLCPACRKGQGKSKE